MIVTLTFNPAVDHTIQIDEQLRQGTVQRSDSDRFDAAGKGINAAKFLHALGTDVTAAGPVGGFPGEIVRDQLVADGIEVAFTSISGRTRINTTVQDSSGEYKINMDGPQITDHDVAALETQIDHLAPGLLVMGGSLPPGMAAADVDRLMDRDCRIALDVSGGLLQELDQTCFLIKPNEDELADATGRDVDTVEDAITAAEALQDQGYDQVLGSLGSQGAVLVTDDGTWHATARQCTVADTVGAGDALLAGYLARIEDGDGPERALQQAIELATRVVELSGPQIPAVGDLADASTAIEIERYR